ncbi:Uncharacterized protein APZ42_029075 [Daphnia magna]|uniref:Uncharacterized protein n=1 Tax=Daphnia magna TaxID=35525 RepID=A0A162D5L2_9CRUS|nr:Uncharacterized protein APZ42_029075 [Daphnia magna]
MNNGWAFVLVGGGGGEFMLRQAKEGQQKMSGWSAGLWVTRHNPPVTKSVAARGEFWDVEGT